MYPFSEEEYRKGIAEQHMFHRKQGSMIMVTVKDHRHTEIRKGIHDNENLQTDITIMSLV